MTDVGPERQTEAESAATAGSERAVAVVQALRRLLGAPVVGFVPDDPALHGAVWSAAPEVPADRVPTLEAVARRWQAGDHAGGGQPGGDHAGGGQAGGGQAETEFVDTVADLDWQAVLSVVRGPDGTRAGVVVVARDKAELWSTPDLEGLETLKHLCVVTADDAESDGQQRHLDDLVTRVAVELMPVAAASLTDALEWTLQTLSEFFGMDTSFLRKNDLENGLSILVAEYPVRENIPDPDPLGVVPFEADPVFAATRELKEPFVMRPSSSPDAYQERVQQGSGIQQVSMAMVPLVQKNATAGVLGFVKFGDRSWTVAETNALQAVASLIVQLQARVDAEERLQYHAYHDDLTELPNRRALLEELHQRLTSGDPHQTALLFLDLDRFKVMNDFLGHGAGDRLLVTIAERLRAATRTGDFVARLAGDEFVLLLDRELSEFELVAVADRLLEIVAEPIELGGHHITRTGSMGIAIASVPGMTDEELLGHADAALHRAKAQGGNQAVVFNDALQAAVQERTDTELLLRNAIDEGGLELYFQPEINLRTGHLLAVEALVRWHHPTRGLLPAGSFITAAEETGLIVDLGRWVLAEACRQMAEWKATYPKLRLTMRVNMSPAQLASRNIVGLVADCLMTNRLQGQDVCLEITEHAVMQDVKQAVQALQELKSLGVSLAIDDFGTGFSSMAQLKRLPVDTLKVDQSFVSGLGIDPGDRAIVDSIVRLAESFGLELVAEGVETVELVNELLSLGCYRAQGFLLCRPKPAGELVPLLVQGGIDLVSFVPRVVDWTSALVQ